MPFFLEAATLSRMRSEVTSSFELSKGQENIEGKASHGRRRGGRAGSSHLWPLSPAWRRPCRTSSYNIVISRRIIRMGLFYLLLSSTSARSQYKGRSTRASSPSWIAVCQHQNHALLSISIVYFDGLGHRIASALGPQLQVLSRSRFYSSAHLPGVVCRCQPLSTIKF